MKARIIVFIVTLVMIFSCAGDSHKEEQKKPEKENLYEIKKYDGEKYKPEQPIKFSHKNDIPEGMKCEYCHKSSEKLDSVRKQNNQYGINGNPIKSVDVHKLPNHLKLEYKHKNPVGDMSDCNRCHY